MKKLLLVLTLAASVFFSDTAKGDDTAWQIIKIGDRDYLSLENVARFYQLRITSNSTEQKPVLSDGRVRLEVHGNLRELYVNGAKQWLSFPLVFQNGEMLISRFDLAKTIDPCLRPSMINNLEPFHTVVLDAGHGGDDNGERSLIGSEKDYTLDVVCSLKKSLEAKGLKVIVTRSSDAYLPLENRAYMANHTSDAVFVSIHFNSSADASASGFEVFSMTPRGVASTSDGGKTPDLMNQMPGNDFDDASLSFANCVQHSLLGHFPDNDRGVKRARFAVLRLTHAPAILVEGGFMTNGAESRKINDAAWRQKLADSIAQGIRSYQDLAQYKQPPKLLADYRLEQAPTRKPAFKPTALLALSTVEKAAGIPFANASPNPGSRLGLFWIDALPADR